MTVPLGSVKFNAQEIYPVHHVELRPVSRVRVGTATGRPHLQ